MFSDWTGRWEQLLLEQKPRMYIVQEDGGLTESAISSKNLNSKNVVLVVDVGTRALWIWHGKDVGPKDKFVGARAARALRSVVGPTFRTMSPIEEGEESSDFLKAFESGGLPEKPSTPAIQLEDMPEEPQKPVIQLEDTPASTEELVETVPNSSQTKPPMSSHMMINADESKIETPSEATLPSMASEKLRDLVTLIVTYTLRQIYRTGPLTSRIKMYDLFRVGKEDVQQCKVKIELQNTTIKVVEAFFDEKEEESAFYDTLTEYLQLLRKISLSR